MKVSIWARNDDWSVMKYIWGGDLETIPHIGWQIKLDGMTGSVPVTAVVLYPDGYGAGIGAEDARVIVQDPYGEFSDEDG